MNVSRRMNSVQSPMIVVVGDLIRRNPGTISLGQGVVYYGPPREALEVLTEFDEVENHKYKPVVGIPPLVQLLETKLQKENGISIEPESAVVVTAGGNMGFYNAILSITDPGDEVIIQHPYYFNHEMAIHMANCKAVLVPTDSTFQLQIDRIREAITPKTRAIVTISPNNPSGAVYPAEVLQEVNRLCRENGLFHIHDEAYEYFLYEGLKHFSPGSISGAGSHTISLYSLSKSYGFASWRIGYMVIPKFLLQSVRKAQDTILICPPVISQVAAVKALEVGAGYCREKLVEMSDVRQLVLKELSQLKEICTVCRSCGAFYLLVKVHTQMDSMDLVRQLIEKYEVAVIPGGTFGIQDECYLRVSYGPLRRQTALDGVGRLVKGLTQLVSA